MVNFLVNYKFRQTLCKKYVIIYIITAVIFNSGSNALNVVSTNLPKPLNTDKAVTIAIVATAIPHTDTIEITLIALCDFFENRYLRAMKKEIFKQ